MARKKRYIQNPDAPVPVQQNLFTHPNVVETPRYNPYPRIYRTLDGFKKVLAEAGSNLYIDFEFDTPARPTIIGIANDHEAASLRWSDDLAHEVIDSGKHLIAYSTAGAEAEVFKRKLDRTPPLEQWGDAMLRHYLDNADLTKAPGKDEDDESDAGALGFMGLATAITLYTHLPVYKNCRGPACSGPCPTHEPFGYNAVDSWAGGKVDKGAAAGMAAKKIPESLYRELIELSFLCEEMKQRGVKIDTRYVAELSKKLESEKEHLYPYYTTSKGKIVFDGDYSPRSNPQIIEYFAAHGISLENSDKKAIGIALKKRLARTSVSEPTLEELRRHLSEIDPKETNFTLEHLILKHARHTAAHKIELISGDKALTELAKLYAYKDSGKGVEPWFGSVRIDEKDRVRWTDIYLDRTGFAHPRFHVTGASTGRFSSSRPNFQNVPARGWGEDIRKAIIADDTDLCLVKADFSQLELRMCLYLAGLDPASCGADAFTWLVEQAEGKFDEAAARYSMKPRDIAKSVSHGGDYLEGFQVLYPNDLASARIKKEIALGARVVYWDWEYAGGVVSFTGANLAERLFGSRSLENRKKALEIQEGIYFKRFPEIRRWQKSVTEEIDTHGAVMTPSGRYLPLYDPDPDHNAKVAVALKGQGTSADHVQAVMLRLHREAGLVPKMQVHDELVNQFPISITNAQIWDVLGMMEEETWRLPGFKCPVKIGRGANWAEAGDKKNEIKKGE